MSPARPALRSYDHDRRLVADGGLQYLTAWDAIVALPMMQRRLDAREGLDTAGLVSGYPGSPFGGLDTQFRRRRSLLADHAIRFEPGVNEDLAATHVAGTQWVGTGSFATRLEGVFGLWYGKGPGVERSTDAIRSASYQGTSRTGGVLALAGDDHEARSTITAQQSDVLFMHMHMPILTPATVQEVLDFGLAGWALSRAASTWVGIPCVSDLAETAMPVDVDLGRLDFHLPEGLGRPPATGHPRYGGRGAFGAADIESEITTLRLPMARAFARRNGLDRIDFRPEQGRRTVGIVAAGKAYLDVVGVLTLLGLNAARAADLGIGLYKPGLTWPLDPDGLVEFAEGFDELLVVEAKHPVIEDQALRILRRLPADRRPVVVGKADELDRPLLPAFGTFDAPGLARVLSNRLLAYHPGRPELIPVVRERIRVRTALPLTVAGGSAGAGTGAGAAGPVRKAGFCSGCPHNVSTRVPEGSIAVSGTGCHNMSLTVDAPGHQTELIAHMGGEGGLWVGMAPFVERTHAFQNMGDGTYHHSGQLAIRAAVAAGTAITFKILLNGYISMTGGQVTASAQSAATIARQVLDEGVAKVVIVTDDVRRVRKGLGRRLPHDVAVRDRADLDQVQRELAAVPATTVLIYDQACAAELRRQRKHGSIPQPPTRVFINEAVCEGCGDCNLASNCIAVEPLETDLGRKRTINQSACNIDLSCTTGNCPSFVTVTGGTPRTAHSQVAPEVLRSAVDALPEPARRDHGEVFSLLVGGIGGTGVITVAAVLGMAAHLEGLGVGVLNDSGLAQKNGAVEGHVKIYPAPGVAHAPRVGAAGCDVLIGADCVVASTAATLDTLVPQHSWACLNTDVRPTVGFAANPALALHPDPLVAKVAGALGQTPATVAADRWATTLMGDAIYANMLMLGFVAQSGQLPVGLPALLAAIEVNGVAVRDNVEAFTWGRLLAADEALVEHLVAAPVATQDAVAESLESLRRRRRDALVDYQDQEYAARFDDVVAEVAAGAAAFGEDGEALTRTVIESLYKLMAAKDEYEVARLYTDPAFRAGLEAQFEGDLTFSVHLAPQILNRRDPQTGRARKWAVPGTLAMPTFRALAALKRVRGTRLDVFGMTAHRRAERARVTDYVALVRDVIVPGLRADNLDAAVDLAAYPLQIKGFDDVKDRNAAAVDAALPHLVDAFLRIPASHRTPATVTAS